MSTRQIKLEHGEKIQFSFLPTLIAEALHDNEPAREATRQRIAAELAERLRDRTLTVYDPLSLEPLSIVPDTELPKYGVLADDDLLAVLESNDVSLHHYSPKVIRVSTHYKYISVEDAITLITDAVDLPHSVSTDGFTTLEQFVLYTEKNCLLVFENLGIYPQTYYDSDNKFTGEEGQFTEFEITIANFKKYAAYYGVDVEVIGGQQENKTQELMVNKPKTSAPDWTLIKPKRFDTLQEIIYAILEDAHRKGLSKPTPRFVLEEIEKKRPPEFVSLVRNGALELTYEKAPNDVVTVKSDSIRARINRMITLKKT